MLEITDKGTNKEATVLFVLLRTKTSAFGYSYIIKGSIISLMSQEV